LEQAGTDAAGLVLTIDLGALRRNWEHFARLSAPAKASAVVKADAYGIGIEKAVPVLWAAGCPTYFVAVPGEGVRVRKAAPDATIYILNSFAPAWAESCRAHRLRPVLGSVAAVKAWADCAPGEPSGLQVDTGMNRLGLTAREALELARDEALLAKAAPQLVMSHFACADDPKHPMNLRQIAQFREIRQAFPGLAASLAGSAGITLGADALFELTRPGIALYGAEFLADKPPLETVVTAQACVLQVREASAGETVGYSAGQRLDRNRRLAVLSAGYADGYHRLAGSSDARMGGRVWLRGREAPLMGRVSMDLMVADVTDIPDVAAGDWAELFGPNLAIDDAARAADTVGYEFLTQLSRRAARVYVGGVAG
jgi:alanine racemase